MKFEAGQQVQVIAYDATDKVIGRIGKVVKVTLRYNYVEVIVKLEDSNDYWFYENELQHYPPNVKEMWGD